MSRAADARWEREQVLMDLCQELGIDHVTSCYEDLAGGFWVCRPLCPVMIARRRLEKGEQ